MFPAGIAWPGVSGSLPLAAGARTAKRKGEVDGRQLRLVACVSDRDVVREKKVEVAGGREKKMGSRWW